MQAWVTAAWDVWRHASWNPPPPCSSRPWVTDCDMSTASSGNPSETDGSRKHRTTGFVLPTRGRSHARTRRWKST